MSTSTVGDAAIAVVRRNTEEVQGKGNWRVFEGLFADEFVDLIRSSTADVALTRTWKPASSHGQELRMRCFTSTS